MINSPLEFLARIYGNEIRYDADGNPSVFVKFPKMKSSDLDPTLPDHIHPAFIILGEEQDYILIGKYKGNCMDTANTGTIYSQPNMPPAYNRSTDQFLNQCRAFGMGASAMTAADRGLILLLAQKNGWNPGGNSNQGICYRDAQPWGIGAVFFVGEMVGWHGWLYACKKEHTADVSLAPDIAPLYWEKINQIGGTDAYPELHNDEWKRFVTLNGSGPESWYLNGAIDSLSDIVGNQSEMDYGYRVVAGELQIISDNNAADVIADLGATSAAWKAILPNPGDDGYTLVAPGTLGTLHWTYSGGKIVLDTVPPTFDNQVHSTPFSEITANTANLPHIPSIVRELGIFPTEGSKTAGIVTILFSQSELIPRRGGSYQDGSAIGLGCQDIVYRRNEVGAYYGVRVRYQDSF